jgi:hypothetical protein
VDDYTRRGDDDFIAEGVLEEGFGELAEHHSAGSLPAFLAVSTLHYLHVFFALAAVEGHPDAQVVEHKFVHDHDAGVAQ